MFQIWIIKQMIQRLFVISHRVVNNQPRKKKLFLRTLIVWRVQRLLEQAYGVLASCPVNTFCLLVQAPFRSLEFARTHTNNSAGTRPPEDYPGPNR